jgi:hypothetical protein
MDKRRTSRRSLTGKEYDLFHDFFSFLGCRIFYQQVPLDMEVLAPSSTQTHSAYVDNSKNVECLTLVLVKPLDLDIKHGVRINLNA